MHGIGGDRLNLAQCRVGFQRSPRGAGIAVFAASMSIPDRGQRLCGIVVRLRSVSAMALEMVSSTRESNKEIGASAEIERGPCAQKSGDRRNGNLGNRAASTATARTAGARR